MGMGFTGLALGSMLARDGITRAAESDAHRNAAAQAIAENVREQFAPKAKSVIWFFMLGGTSHLESFDPKPAIDKYSGLTIDESPFRSSVLDSPYYRKNVRDFAGTPRALMAQLYPTQIGFRRRGQSGLEVRHRGRPINVDHGQRPRSSTAVSYGATYLRRLSSFNRILGSLWAGLFE
jgi:hypothetical protein